MYVLFQEVELGLAADVGVLQRWTKIANNQSLYRELVYTARQFSADEALQLGLIGRIFLDRKELIAGALRLAETIASKTPVAVQGSKVQMNYARDHKVDDALEYMVSEVFVWEGWADPIALWLWAFHARSFGTLRTDYASTIIIRQAFLVFYTNIPFIGYLEHGNASVGRYFQGCCRCGYQEQGASDIFEAVNSIEDY